MRAVLKLVCDREATCEGFRAGVWRIFSGCWVVVDFGERLVLFLFVLAVHEMSGGTPVGGGFVRQRHSQGYSSGGDDLEDDACSRTATPGSPPVPRSRTWVEFVENVLWIASAMFIVYFGDWHSNLIYLLWHDGRIRRYICCFFLLFKSSLSSRPWVVVLACVARVWWMFLFNSWREVSTNCSMWKDQDVFLVSVSEKVSMNNGRLGQFSVVGRISCNIQWCINLLEMFQQLLLCCLAVFLHATLCSE